MRRQNYIVYGVFVKRSCMFDVLFLGEALSSLWMDTERHAEAAEFFHWAPG